MRIDENVPVDVLEALQASGHDAQSVNFVGMKGLQNGDLLKRAQQQFDLLLTRDKDFTALRQVRPVIPGQSAANRRDRL
jgi:predicted nuclease of predicted toxin-antitoxin system